MCDCLPVGFVTKAQACENHLLPSVKLRRLKPLARRIVFPASTNIRIWSNPNDQMCFPVGASNISHQVDIDKKWTALPTRANVLTLNLQCVDRRSNFQRNTKPGGFTLLLSGGSLLDHIFCPWPFLAKCALTQVDDVSGSPKFFGIPRTVASCLEAGPWHFRAWTRRAIRLCVIAFPLVSWQRHKHVRIVFFHPWNWDVWSHLLDGLYF